MSRTTKNNPNRHAADYYPTPIGAFDPLIKYLIDVDAEYYWEPASGDGRLINAMQKAGLKADGGDLLTGYNFLTDKSNDQSDACVTNPPFSLAEKFIQHAVPTFGHVFFLLRLNFLAGQKRAEMWRKYPVDALFVLSKRPSFTDNGQTDATDYAWFYWGSKYKGIYWL